MVGGGKKGVFFDWESFSGKPESTFSDGAKQCPETNKERFYLRSCGNALSGT